MYQYNEFDQKLVNERAAQFREQTRRFLVGELTEDQYRPLRLMNGLYIQRHAPMLRVAVPYGLLNSKQMRMFAEIARRFDRGYGHFTTRQNLQYNWLKLEEVPDVLELLASVQMHAIQTSGNCIRNTTSDHLAGVTIDELEDPRPYCEIIRQWSTLHPEFAFLPRKFKIAVSGAARDRAATQVHDIGLQLVKNEQGEVGFEVLVGGGLGRTPIIGVVIRPFLEKKHLLSYLEAILRVYNLEGRRDNKYKARIKILVKEKGIEAFREAVEKEWLAIRDLMPLSQNEVDRIGHFFSPHAYQKDLTNQPSELVSALENPEFSAWYQRNTVPHKVAGYRAVFLSLKPHGKPPGDMTDDQMDAVADLMDTYSFGEIRVTHTQNLVLADVKQTDLPEIWKQLSALGLATPNIGTVTDMITCPGLEFCSLANASSIPIANGIQALFDEFDYLYDLGDLRVNISGCMNGCGHHTVGHIGILGVDKKGEEWYQITLGGSSSNDASLGERLGPAVIKEEVPAVIEKILLTYRDVREEGESFLETVRRTGIDIFQERVYASH
jgi:sulfite reductase (NADPH) hemoprotein beta-component